MLVLRILAAVFFLFAAIALAADVSRAQGGGRFTPTSLEMHWKAVAPQLLTSAQQTVSRTLHPAVWDPVILRLISLPSWFLFGAVGLTFGYLGRRQRRVNIFIN